MTIASVALIRLDQVDFHPHNVRQDLGDLRGLTASIKRHGVMQPIVVEKHKGRLRLRAGHRRTAAARLAGLTRVPAVIHDDALEDDEWLIASVQENVHREQLTKQERRRTVRALLDLGCTRRGVAEAFGVGESAVSNWLQEDKSRKPEQVRASEKLRGWKDGRLTGPKVRHLVAEWRDRDADRDTILAELEELFPAPVPIGQRAPTGAATAEGRAQAVATVDARTRAKIADVRELLGAGESVFAIADRLDTTVAALARFLNREAEYELARSFNAEAKRAAA